MLLLCPSGIQASKPGNRVVMGPLEVYNDIFPVSLSFLMAGCIGKRYTPLELSNTG